MDAKAINGTFVVIVLAGQTQLLAHIGPIPENATTATTAAAKAAQVFNVADVERKIGEVLDQRLAVLVAFGLRPIVESDITGEKRDGYEADTRATFQEPAIMGENVWLAR